MSGEKNDQFNMLEALAEHAPDVFRHELVAKHLDTTTTSLLWQVSKKLKSAVEATGVFTAGICELEGCEPEVIFKLSLSNKMYLNGSHVEPLEPGEQPSYCGTGTLFHQVNPELVTTVALAKWAKENGAPMNLRFAMQAVAVGNIDVVRWMVTDLWPRFPVLDQKMASMALANNRKDIFLELRAAGCPIDDEFVCFMAAHEGHFELMKWLHKDEKYDLQDVDLTQVRDTRIMRYLEDNLYTYGAGYVTVARETERVDAPSRSLRKPHVREVVRGGDGTTTYRGTGCTWRLRCGKITRVDELRILTLASLHGLGAAAAPSQPRRTGQKFTRNGAKPSTVIRTKHTTNKTTRCR
jgi:hypothetical protein